MTIEFAGLSIDESALAALKGGQTLSGVIDATTGEPRPSHSGAPTVSTPATSIAISGEQKEIRPSWGRGEGEALVSAPRMSDLNHAHDLAVQAHQEKLQAEAEELRAQQARLAPVALIAELDDLIKRISYLERQNKKLTKDLRGLTNAG